MSDQLPRTLPHSIEAEEQLLGCILLDGPDVINRCYEAHVTSTSFYEPRHARIFYVLESLFAAGKACTVDVLGEELRSRQELDSLGGYPFLAQISSRVPTTAEANYFLGKVRELALRREVIRTSTMAVEECYANSGHIDELMDGIEQKMFAATQKRVSDKTVPARQIVPEAMAIINTMVSRKGEMTGLRSGFADLDCLTWGFQKSDLIIIAARPSQGKTALALNIAEAMIYPQTGKGVGVLIFSLEMSGTQLMQRMICSRARVNMKLLRDGLVSKTGDDLLRMKNAADDIARAGLFIDDTSAIPVSHIRARARRVHARNPLGCIIVDYLQLMAPTNASTPREQQVAEASRGLKALAKELNVPVIVLSQLNRSSEKDNRPPRLSDLRESGSIEQDADVVLMLSRPKDADDRYQTAADSMDLVVAKQRNGPVGTLKLSFLRDITRFENYTQ
jgi:replicative DNA helicase